MQFMKICIYFFNSDHRSQFHIAFFKWLKIYKPLYIVSISRINNILVFITLKMEFQLNNGKFIKLNRQTNSVK